MPKPETRTFFLKLYFLFGGYMSLLCWNSILNMTSFFIISVNPKIYTNLGFGFCLGGLTSFLISPIIFKSLNFNKSIFLSLFLNLLTFLLVLIFCILDISILSKEILTTVIIIINGFFNSFFQGKLAALASSHSSYDIALFSFGTGLVGVLSNVVYYVITILVPVDENNKLASLTNQMLLYLVVVLVCFVFFFGLQIAFLRKFGDAFDEDEKNMEIIFDESLIVKDTQESMGEAKIIIRSFDLLFGMFFNYTIVINIVGCFLIETQLFYDQTQNNGKGNGLTIPFFIFFYNISDTIGKYLPQKLFFKSSRILHFCAICQLIFWGYYIYILTNKIEGFLTSPIFRCFVPSFLGVLNGFYTNNFFVRSAERFGKKMEKGKSGFFCLMFMLAGITSGSFLNFMFKN